MKILVIGANAKSLMNLRGDFIKELLKANYEVVACSNEPESEEIRNFIVKNGIKHYSIQISQTSLNPLADSKIIIKIAKILKEELPDIIFSYNIKPVIYSSIAESFVSNIKTFSLITGIGSNLRGKNKIVDYIIERLLILFGKKNTYVFQNIEDKKLFIDRNISKKDNSYIVNGSGVNIDHFAQKPVPLGNVSFLYVGRLIKEKGIYDYIAAARMISNEYDNVTFSVLGSPSKNKQGPGKVDIGALHKENIINYIGYVDDVREVINEHSVVVLPSYYGEGIPRSLLEALSMGRPIITTDSRGCNVTVRDGYNGFKVPIKSPESIYQAAKKLISNPSLMQIMGERSRSLAESKFDVRIINSQLLDIIDGGTG